MGLCVWLLDGGWGANSLAAQPSDVHAFAAEYFSKFIRDPLSRPLTASTTATTTSGAATGTAAAATAARVNSPPPAAAGGASAGATLSPPTVSATAGTGTAGSSDSKSPAVADLSALQRKLDAALLDDSRDEDETDT